jgi:hypothetical protein
VLSGFNYVGDRMNGAQIAAANVAGGVNGAQLGVLNVATGTAHGAQLGLVNLARESDAPVGLVSIVTEGRTNVDAWHDMGLTRSGVVHGGKYVHNMYGGGVRLYGESPRPLVALGIGVRVVDRSSVAFDVDAIAYWMPDGNADRVQLVSQLRAVTTLRLARSFALLRAPRRSQRQGRDDRLAVRPPNHAHGSALAATPSEYQAGPASHIAIAPATLRTRPMDPSTSACRMGSRGARRAVR